MSNLKYRLLITLLLPLAAIVSLHLPAQELNNKDARIVMTGPVYLVMQDMKLINEGEIIAGTGNVLFTGNEVSGIGGNKPVTFNNVIINKSFGKAVELHQNISVAGILTMKSGNILLNNHQLDLGKTGSIAGESSHSYITGVGGSVLVGRILATPPTAFNPGNIGVEITSGIALGKVLIERKHNAEILPGGAQAILRNFYITSSVDEGLDAEVRLYYLDEELAGADEGELNIWTGSFINNSWILAGQDGSDFVLNWISKTGLDRLGRFTLASSSGTTSRQISSAKKSIKKSPIHRSGVQVYPNPSQDKCMLEFFNHEKKRATLKLYDQWGRLLEHKNVTYLPGMNRIIWDLKKYAAGIYMVTDETGFVKVKIIRQ